MTGEIGMYKPNPVVANGGRIAMRSYRSTGMSRRLPHSDQERS